MTDAGSEALTAMEPRFVAPALVERDAEGKPRLRAGRCRECGALSFPSATVCANCLSENIEPTTLARDGVLYSYSIVHRAPRGWRVPYALGYVDLPEGIRVLAHLGIPAEALCVDLPVRLDAGIVGTDEQGAPLQSYIFVRRD